MASKNSKNESVEASAKDVDPEITLMGRRVRTKDEGEGGEVEEFVGIVTDYNPVTQEHCITYEVGTSAENFEWMNVFKSKDVVEILPGPAEPVEELPEPPAAGAAESEKVSQ